MSSHPFAELICAYLDGLPGAAEVLNDALEEAGRARIAVEGATGERLALVLESLLTEPLARRVAVDYAKHVAQFCDGSFARAVLNQKSTQVDPAATPADIQRAEAKLESFEDDRMLFESMSLRRLGWNDENTPKASAAWALWGALQIPVRFVSLAAQRVSTTELDWQVEHLKELLTHE